jgi:hypothetical protein
MAQQSFFHNYKRPWCEPDRLIIDTNILKILMTSAIPECPKCQSSLTFNWKKKGQGPSLNVILCCNGCSWMIKIPMGKAWRQDSHVSDSYVLLLVASIFAGLNGTKVNFQFLLINTQHN